jgi:peptidyl-prolyl cis-trans isomerase C
MLRNTLLAFSTVILAAQTPAPKPAVPATPRLEAPAREDKILGRIGNRVYRESDFELFLSLALNQQQRMQVEIVQGAKEQYRKQFLDFKVMEVKARKDGLDKGPEFLKKRELMEAQILIQDLMQRDAPGLQAKIVVQDADVKAYFDKHPDQFKTKESFDARHILIGIKADEKGKTEEDAKAKLVKLQEELKAGKKLQELTKDYSDDPGSKEKGGLYENITYGSFMPEFEEAVKKQEIGAVGEPVKTAYGYHLIQVEKRTPSTMPEFETIKEQVRQKAQAAKQEEVFQDYVSGLKKEITFLEGAEALKAPATKAGKRPTKGTKKATGAGK